MPSSRLNHQQVVKSHFEELLIMFDNIDMLKGAPPINDNQFNEKRQKNFYFAFQNWKIETILLFVEPKSHFVRSRLSKSPYKLCHFRKEIITRNKWRRKRKGKSSIKQRAKDECIK